MILGVASWAFALCGCQADQPAPIQGEVKTLGKDNKTAKQGGPMTPQLNDSK